MATTAAPSPADLRWQRHWQNQWYGVAILKDLDPERPLRFTLLE